MALSDVTNALLGTTSTSTPTTPLPTLTPDSIKRRRAMAELLMKQGMDFSPIASPWQGVARLANAFVGGLEDRRLDRMEAEGQQRSNERFGRIAAMLAGSDAQGAPSAAADAGPAPAGSGAGVTPSFVRTGGKMAQAPSEFMPFFEEASQATGIPVPVLTAKVAQESRFDPNARGGAGEVGLAQILPSTARDPGFGLQGTDPAALRDPRTNIIFGAQYLAARGKAAGVQDWNDPTQVAKALTAYNGGGDPNYASNVMRYLPGDFGRNRTAQALAQTQVASADPRFVPGSLAYGDPSSLAQRLPYTPAPGMDPASFVQRTPYDPNAAPQGNLVTPAASGLPAASGAPQAASLPAMAGGAGQMRLPGEVADLHPALVQRLAQAASSPQVQQAAAVTARTPQGQALMQKAQTLNMAELAAAMSDPWMGEGQKSLLLMMMKDKMGGQFGFQTLPDGTIIRTDSRRGTVEPIYQAPAKPVPVKDGEGLWNPTTKQWEVAPGDANTTESKNYARDMADRRVRGQAEIPYGDWLTAYRKNGANSVTIDQKTEGAFDQAIAKSQADLFSDMAKEGVAARSDVGQIRQLRDQLAKLPGGFVTGVQGLANSYGIKLGPNASTIEAVDAILNRLTPAQRQGMPGAASDRDVAMFRSALPKLSNTPQGNGVILDTMEALAVYRQKQAEIANRVMTGRMTRAQGMDALEALPDPFGAFKGAGGERLVDPGARPAAPGGKSFEHLWR